MPFWQRVHRGDVAAGLQHGERMEGVPSWRRSGSGPHEEPHLGRDAHGVDPTDDLLDVTGVPDALALLIANAPLQPPTVVEAEAVLIEEAVCAQAFPASPADKSHQSGARVLEKPRFRLLERSCLEGG
eukprot:CAMPEP_0117584422 /NCGR_PEP_ID=MMETSP0784-20121206/67590_1 /TAXON_ID=39447 /ORGANISM="" /LENGTH=127 /DNA_ID=CAMNT_0005385275 /DNA_START=116 /DNA_END=499 /DNA_ORIENTATION=-